MNRSRSFLALIALLLIPVLAGASPVDGPDMAGILAHEAIGHTTEADFVLNGSVAARLLNEAILPGHSRLEAMIGSAKKGCSASF
jgi:hypothetical protein